jgi:hypothetical protein
VGGETISSKIEVISQEERNKDYLLARFEAGGNIAQYDRASGIVPTTQEGTTTQNKDNFI